LDISFELIIENRSANKIAIKNTVAVIKTYQLSQ